MESTFLTLHTEPRSQSAGLPPRCFVGAVRYRKVCVGKCTFLFWVHNQEILEVPERNVSSYHKYLSDAGYCSEDFDCFYRNRKV